MNLPTPENVGVPIVTPTYKIGKISVDWVRHEPQQTNAQYKMNLPTPKNVGVHASPQPTKSR